MAPVFWAQMPALAAHQLLLLLALAGAAVAVAAAAPATAGTAAAPRLVRAGGGHSHTRRFPATRVADRGPEGQRSSRAAVHRFRCCPAAAAAPARGRRPLRPKPALGTRHMGSTWASRCSRGILGSAEALERCSSCAHHRLNLLPNCERWDFFCELEPYYIIIRLELLGYYYSCIINSSIAK